jgi:hypothetical protein
MLAVKHINNHIIRIVAVGLFFVVALVGGAWGAMATVFDAIFFTPVITRPIDDTYYFTQQQYGFATMVSNGYNLTFYRQRSFWSDQELGTVQLECAGTEVIHAMLLPTHMATFRLRIAADNQERLDTTLISGIPFNFRRTFENRTLDFSKRP